MIWCVGHAWMIGCAAPLFHSWVWFGMRMFLQASRVSLPDATTHSSSTDTDIVQDMRDAWYVGSQSRSRTERTVCAQVRSRQDLVCGGDAKYFA